MPFDPKLIHQAEAPLNETGDLALPDDLLELAAQLGDDAQYLAKTFPATPSIGLLSAVLADANVGRSSAPSCQEVDIAGRSTAPSYDHTNAPTHIRRTSRRLLRAVALVASLAALAVGATLWYPRGENDPQSRNLAATPERLPTEATHLASNNDATDNTLPPAPAPASPPAPAPPAPATRDTFLHEYSGPELEGIYDLIGDSEDDKISI